MIVLGLLLLLIAAAAILAAALRGGSTVSVDLGWFTVKTDASFIFAAGAVTLLLAVLGLWLVQRGLKRSRNRRVENRQLRQRAEESERLAATRQRETSTSGSGVGSGSGSGSATGTRPGRPLPSGSSPSGTTSGSHPADESGPDEHFDSAPKER